MPDAQPGIIDAHAHVWDATTLTYPWLTAVPTLPRLARAERLIDETAASEYIFIEAGVDAGSENAEVDWVTRSDWPGLRGIVAAVDLRAGDLGSRLDALRRTPLVVGVRHNLQGEPEGALTDPRLAEALREVAARGLTFDACVRRQQLGELSVLVESAPSAHVVVDHFGKPAVGEGLTGNAGRVWQEQIQRLADAPSTYVKLSGLSAEVPDTSALRLHGPAFVRAAVDAFGADRCMIGSDWPVSTTLGAAASFGSWAELVREALTPAEWPAVAARTAETFYLRARRA